MNDPEESKHEARDDELMRSATPAKTAQPAGQYMPIKVLNQFTQDWSIKARVVKKAEMRQWSNAKSSGNLLNFDLIDREGTLIQATAFNESAIAFNKIIEPEAVYTFSNGLVKLANKRFTSIKNDYCLTFGKEGVCQRCADDEDI